ncbi:hypothetical protein ABL78_6841 [Leptomonas seymouri]|uniref:Uncharacterized protein n=1 Tax=Leptomonas seymouri TaxID=5684 RepID=A0A0N1PA48_LEPSE|nr:hypothetical protein ABL78_6841 [Leptomonas seymouri]|eukprot:KPI84104.1 hypothetical protein ABL78_6841 [Leptomonas seymouri]
MIFLIANAAISAIFFLIVVLPILYIYNPDRYPGESNSPPSAGEVIPDEDVTHAVKQKLFLLFIIPTCAAVNAIFLYFAYYRPIRFIHYRVELNLLTLRLTLDVGRQQLQKSGVLASSSRATSSVANLSIIGNISVLARSYGKVSGRSFALDGNERSRQKLATSLDWEWRRHARPKSVRRDAWVNSAVFAEISALRDEVEQCFLLECSVADANFTKAVAKTVGVFLPASTPTMLERQAQLQKPATVQKDFYNSGRPPLLMLGARTSMPEKHNDHNPIKSDGTEMLGAHVKHGQLMPNYSDLVVMVPKESSRHKGGGGSGDEASSGWRGNGRASALRFFRSGRKSGGANDDSSGHRLEEGAPSAVSRCAFEPLEPLSGETAAWSASYVGDSTRGNDEGASGSRQKF